ncbi:MAG: hypothetical protein FJ278_18760 [Planctomycetes bacterium]|nr:hypothetical protein [Planctomycetota bacterium]
MRLLSVAWIVYAGLTASNALACDIPVFRYALERWMADAYRLTVFHAGPLDEASKALVKKLEESNLNLAVIPLDVSKGVPEQWKAAGVPSDLSQLPWMALRYPLTGEASDAVVWSGRFDAKTVEVLRDSPSRKEIARRLLSGHSAVWLVVESGNAAEDDKAVKTLEERLKYIESVAALPERDPNDPSSMLGPGPELAVKLSVLRMSRKDPTEAAMLAMLEAADEESKKFRAVPVVFPVFGRGRALGLVPKDSLVPETLDQICMLLLGPCSCEIKGMHPGWDLVMDVNWDEELVRAEEARETAAESKASVPTSEPAAKPETVTIHGSTEPPQKPDGTVWPAWAGPVLIAAGVIVIALILRGRAP